MDLFPYSKQRPEQDELIRTIRNSIENKKDLLVHAPTGLGKTVAALVPALEHALKNNLVVFFLTSRHTQHAIAVDTIQKIKEKHEDANIIVTDLVGKRNMCLQDGVSALRPGEFHEYCKKHREEGTCTFYTNTKSGNKNTPQADVFISDIKRRGALHTEQINEACKTVQLCPYEVATSLAKDSTVVIADYSYIFGDSIRNSLFRRIQRNLGECIVIVDEAHNLPRRIIDSGTERLTTFMLRRAIQECNKLEFTEMAVKLTQLMEGLLDMTKEIAERNKDEVLLRKDDFVDVVNSIQPYDLFMKDLENITLAVIENQKQSFTGSVLGFMEAWQGEDEGFVRILSNKDRRMTLSYKCLDPSVMSRDVIKQTYCTVAMSGTLLPTDMYRDVLGFEDAEEKVFKSPFPEENKLSIIVPRTTTKFSARSEEQYKQIADAVVDITNTIPGNSAVFFPSYFIRDNVYKHFAIKTDKTTFLETQEMSKQDKTDMLERFKSYAKSGAVLLGTTAGNFSEGVDLIGDFLKCVVVVGLPLQQPDLETQEAIKYYDYKFQKGWDYGYVFPAFNKVLQGAGRCIRSETDRGVVVFLDERYSWPQYLRCFPEDMNLTIKRDHLEEIKDFFGSG